MFNELLCSKSNSSLTCPVHSNCQFDPGKTFNPQIRSEYLRHVNKERTEERIHICMHAFIYESSDYVQLFASNLVRTTQAQFTARSKRFCLYR